MPPQTLSSPLPPAEGSLLTRPLSATHASARLAFELLQALDLDGDGRLTERDAARAREAGLRFAVDLELGPGVRLELAGAERLAHAADVLAEEILAGRGEAPGLPVERLLEGRTTSLRRLIDQGWEGLVRRSDRAEDLKRALAVMPVKDPEGTPRVYVPARDRGALKRLRAQGRRAGGLEVVPLHRPREAQDWSALMRQPGMLYLPRPYIVPGGRFVQMFGWDSYFNARGALASGHTGLARDMLENQLYEIEHYGKIPNSNLSYHLSRTQPPLMPRLALAVHAARADRRLLKRVARVAEQELEEVFRTGPRATQSGLSRYKDDAEGPDAEDLAAFYAGARPDSAEFHRHDRAIRESGWDMCHRFGTATHHHEPVCLNSLLYQYELDVAALLREVEGTGSLKAARHARAARARVRTMRARFWDAERGLFFDHDCWLSLVLDIAGGHNGLIKEKYDVVARSADVAVEYGNQGADRGAPLAPRSERTLGFAWTNASVLLLLEGLSPGLREALDAGVPADRVLGPLLGVQSTPGLRRNNVPGA